jgi:hypothetical protein
MIAINGDADGYRRAFGSMERVATLDNAYSMPWERAPIYLCRDPKVDLNQLWPHTKVFR